MSLPQSVPLRSLLVEAPEYTAIRPHVERIELLAIGGHALKSRLGEFLHQRPGEIGRIYQQRLTKFSYSNALGAGISQLASRLSNAPVYALGADSPEWDSIRSNNDGHGRTEQQLINRLFTEMVIGRSVWAHTDRPYSDTAPVNLAQERALGLPRVVLYNALQVPDWGHDANGDLEWCKVYQVSAAQKGPLQPALLTATWTIIDANEVTRYAHHVRLRDGKISALLDANGEDLGLDLDTMIPMVSVVAHGFGRCPVVRSQVPRELWAGDHAYGLAESLLRMECHRDDLLTSAYMQRSFKRRVSPDALDLDSTAVDADDAPLPTGTEYVLEVDSFSWNEPSGAIIEPLSMTIEAGGEAVKRTLAVGGSRSAANASGEAKKMDYIVELERLGQYGAILVDSLNDIYGMVGQAMSAQPPRIDGLDSFAVDALAELLERLDSVTKLDHDGLSAKLGEEMAIAMLDRVKAHLTVNLPPDQR